MPNELATKLEKLGYEIPQAKKKVDTSKINLLSKIDKALEFINKSYTSYCAFSESSGNHDIIQDSITLNYQRFCESIKDSLKDICCMNNVKLTSESLAEVLRKTNDFLPLTRSQKDALTYIQIRNDVVHDYFNTDYFDEQVLLAVSNHYNDFVSYCKSLYDYVVQSSAYKNNGDDESNNPKPLQL
jgi:uncharacterized protein with HEPN domain